MFKKILFVLALTFLFSALFSFTLPSSSQIVTATPPYTLIERIPGNRIEEFPYTIQDGDGVIYTIFADTDQFGTHVYFQRDQDSADSDCTRVIWNYPISATDGATARMAEGEGVCQGSTGTNDFESAVGDIATNVTIGGIPSDPSDPSDPGSGGEAGTVANTCESLNPGLGWIACAIMAWSVNFLGELTVTSEGGGFLGSILNFSLEGNQEDAIRAVWSGFRVLANSLFVIMFLFVIYSAATGSVINAYDLKRLLPRLIFSAIAVQLSFFISLTLLNLFNDIGMGAGQLLLAPLPGEEGTASAVESILVASPMTDLARFALPLVYLLLTIVVAIMAIVGVLMMAVLFIVRNMGLVILIAISPIAFVLWTLPNTERIFKKWWEWFIQLLAVFPIAALFFASGKLIAYVWIGGTGGEDTDLGENEIGNVLIGTIALFAPYFLAPKLIMFSGSAIKSVYSGLDNAKQKVTNREFMQRGKARMKAAAYSGLDSRRNNLQEKLNTGDPGLMRRGLSKAVGSKALNRYSARAQRGFERMQAEDTEAANIQLRSAEDRAKAAANLAGTSPDNAAIDTLQSVALNSGASLEQRSAAAKRLINIYGSKEPAVASVREMLSTMQNSTNQREIDMGGRIIDENIGALSSKMPHTFKGEGVAQMPTESVLEFSGGAIKDMVSVSSDGARQTLTEKFVEASKSSGLRGEVDMSKVTDLYNSLAEKQASDPSSNAGALINDLQTRYEITTTTKDGKTKATKAKFAQSYDDTPGGTSTTPPQGSSTPPPGSSTPPPPRQSGPVADRMGFSSEGPLRPGQRPAQPPPQQSGPVADRMGFSSEGPLRPGQRPAQPTEPPPPPENNQQQ